MLFRYGQWRLWLYAVAVCFPVVVRALAVVIIVVDVVLDDDDDNSKV